MSGKYCEYLRTMFNVLKIVNFCTSGNDVQTMYKRCSTVVLHFVVLHLVASVHHGFVMSGPERNGQERRRTGGHGNVKLRTL